MKVDRIQLWSLLAIALFIRLLSLGAYPLMDTTEARYGEMARLMVETGNWLTPQFDYGVPFWGKPPLFAWMSAVGIKLMGVHEVAVRLPHWIAGILVVAITAWFARRAGTSGLMTSVILASCGIFVIASGSVMTDMALTLGLTIAMIGFYQSWLGQRIWGYVGFAGLAIGLLAKGPLALALMGVAVMPWLFLQHGFIGSFKALWQRMPLIPGSLLMLAIALPWYLMAEAATPGFLDYFIVGEHFKRFLISGWEGDRYGTAHIEPYGTIWLFWFYATIPWSLVLPVLLWKQRTRIKQMATENSMVAYLLSWMVAPMILFTLSGNILPTYVLPGIPAFGVLIAMLMGRESAKKLWFKGLAVIMSILICSALVMVDTKIGEQESDKGLLNHADLNTPIYYIDHRPFSGQFYSRGRAKILADEAQLKAFPEVQLIGQQEMVEPIIEQYQLNCVVVYTSQSGRSLYRCKVRRESSMD